MAAQTLCYNPATMFYPYTAQQQQWIDLAATLAEGFARRAAAADRSGAFPFENYASLRAAGLPALVAPKEYGGWGANLLDTVLVMEELGVGDGSTALSVTMHMQTIGNAVEDGAWPAALLARVCRAAVERGALINAVASEPELGSPSRGGKPKTVAQPVLGADGAVAAWVLNGRKSYASMSPTLDTMIIPALLLDGSDEVARFVVDATLHRDRGLQIIETWDALGMRSTGSHDVLLSDVTVPADSVITRGVEAKSTTGGQVNAWFLLTVSAVYVGVARAALRCAAEYACSRVPTALGKPIAEVESIQRHLGQAELLLQQARLLLYHTAELWDRHPTQRIALGPSVNVAKVTATNHAIAAVDHCMRVAGGAGMTRALPLERYFRDVRAGLNHPVNDDAAFVQLGKLVLAELQQAQRPATAPDAAAHPAPARAP